jgi:hypothetical protein
MGKMENTIKKIIKGMKSGEIIVESIEDFYYILELAKENLKLKKENIDESLLAEKLFEALKKEELIKEDVLKELEELIKANKENKKEINEDEEKKEKGKQKKGKKKEKINKSKLDIYKIKYPKLWEEVKELENAEELFLKQIKIKERDRKIKDIIEQKKKKERKRETRALIIFAKLMLKELSKNEIEKLLNKYSKEFIQKERGKEIDYSKYIWKLIEKRKEE